jgi:biopolymer transport protein ExbD
MGGSVGSEDGDIGFQIAPMVDVVFVLMLFFMASVGSKIVEKELNINLPSGAGKPGSISPLVIEISQDGRVSVNSKVYGGTTDRDLTELRDVLEKVIGNQGSNDPVIIKPSPDARHERIVDVLNAASYAHVSNLTFN